MATSSSTPALETQLTSAHLAPSSPHHDSEIASPSSPTSPLLHNFEMELASDSDDGIVFEKRRPKLAEIYGKPDDEHRLTLEDWTLQFKASERNLGRKLSNCTSSKSDIYQILGLFFVFQGVILTAVAQSNLLHCNNWSLVFSLSLIVSLGAILASVQKLKELAEFQEQHLLERALYLSLYKSIENLKEQGRAFDLQNNQPEIKKGYTRAEIFGKGSFARRQSILQKFCSVWVFSYAGGVMFLLCAFSMITLISVPRILCYPGDSP